MKNSFWISVRRKSIQTVLLLIFSSLLLPLAASASPFISPNEIHPGMTGYGKTVFQGTEIETFPVIALGVLHKAIPGSDLILVKIQSPYLQKHHLGVVEGMSGSPVYFQGKLAGAIAYGWSFLQEPIAGVIPITSMLLIQKERNKKITGFGFPRKISLSQQEENLFKTPSSSLSSLPIPMIAGGFNSSGIQKVHTLFPDFEVINGGALIHLRQVPPLLPGAPIGVALMEGDLSLIAAGTLTYRNGAEILAFGHPLLSLGNVNLPLYQAYVHYVVPSIQDPEKLFSPVREVGEIFQDHLYGISGKLYRRPSMIPMEITVTDVEQNSSWPFHVRLARNLELIPRLVAAALDQAATAAVRSSGNVTARLDYRLSFQNELPLHRRTMVLLKSSSSSSLTKEILQTLTAVLENDFQKVNLLHIRVKIAVEPEPSVAALEKVILRKRRLKPGEPLQLVAVFHPYNQKPVWKKLSIGIPSDVTGKIQVGIAGGESAEALRRAMQQPPPEPQNISQVLHAIQETPPSNSLVIRLAFPRKEITWRGIELANFPEPYARLLKQAGAGPIETQPDAEELRFPLPWIVSDRVLDKIEIENPAESFSPSDSEDSRDASPESLSAKSAEPESEEEKTEERTHIKTLSHWKDWRKGTLENLAISPNEDLELAPKQKSPAVFPQTFLWAEAGNEKTIYVGTGSPGEIFRIEKGEKKLFFDPHTPAVTCLLLLPNGDLLAGTLSGKLYRLDSSAAVKQVWKFPEQYVWQAVRAKDSLVYIGAGNPRGTLYRLNLNEKNPKPVLVIRSPEPHILSLCAFPDGRIWAGTGNHALLLEIQPDGKMKIIARFDAEAVLALTGDSQGNLYIGTSGTGKGNIYRLDPNHHLDNFAQLSGENITWLGMNQENLMAGTGIPARLYQINPQRKISLRWDGEPEELTALEGDSTETEAEKTSPSFLASGTSGKLFQLLSQRNGKGEFRSDPVDVGNSSALGRIRWFGDTPPGTEILVQTRTGNTPSPDTHWSSWSLPYPEAGAASMSPNARYLQFRATLLQKEGDRTPELEALQLFYRAEISPPVVKIRAPNPGDVIGEKSTLEGEIEAEAQGVVKVALWAEFPQKEEKLEEKLIAVSKGKTHFSLALGKISREGSLSLKLLAENEPVEPQGTAKNPETLIQDLRFDSSLPTLTISRMESKDGKLEVNGEAEDTVSYVKRVEFRWGKNHWTEALPDNGVFDSPVEKFSIRTEIPKEVNEIEIRALDAADNEVKVKRKIP